MTTWHELNRQQRDDLMRRHMADGERAQQAGGTMHECPHRRDSQEAVWWRRGWGNAVMGSAIGNKR